MPFEHSRPGSIRCEFTQIGETKKQSFLIGKMLFHEVPIVVGLNFEQEWIATSTNQKTRLVELEHQSTSAVVTIAGSVIVLKFGTFFNCMGNRSPFPKNPTQGTNNVCNPLRRPKNCKEFQHGHICGTLKKSPRATWPWADLNSKQTTNSNIHLQVN